MHRCGHIRKVRNYWLISIIDIPDIADTDTGSRKRVLGVGWIRVRLEAEVRRRQPDLSAFSDRLAAGFGEAFYCQRQRNLYFIMARALTDATRRSSSQLLGRIGPK